MTALVLWFLHYVVVIQLAVGTIGLFVVDPADGDSVETGAGATTTTTAAGKATTTTAKSKSKSKGTVTTGATGETGTSTTTTTTPVKATTASTAGPGGQALRPAAAGKYDYRITNTDADGESDTSTGRYTISAAREVDGELRQTEVDDEDGTTITNNYAWRSDGLYLRSFDGDDSGCDFEPDIKLVASPPTVGRQWSIDASCTAEGQTVSLQGTSRISRTDRITVAGTQLDVHVIDTTATGGGSEFRAVTFFSVQRGLTVRDETTLEDGSREVTELLNIDPK